MIRGERFTSALWAGLASFSDTFTCYSAAIATWVACEHEDWARTIDPGLQLTVDARPDGLFSFAFYRPGLRADLGLVRTGVDGPDPAGAVAGVMAELRKTGRILVAGDGFHLPWHVAFQRQHVPHWYVLVQTDSGFSAIDPFACRNELGIQAASVEPLSEDALGPLLPALPGDDPIYRMREALAFGDDAPPSQHRYQWFVQGPVAHCQPPAGVHGPEALMALGRHFREHGQSAEAYAQADDIWSIGRHRAFLCRHAERVAERDDDGVLAEWVAEHGAPVAKWWGRISPLMMQARLALAAGRSASASVPDTLEQLATLEQAAAADLPKRWLGC